MVLSSYFAAAVQAQSTVTGPLPLTLLGLGSNGQIEQSTTMMFRSADPLWIQFPTNAISPYSLSITNENGKAVYSVQSGEISKDRLLQIILSPRTFPPGTYYHAILSAILENAAGIDVGQSFEAYFIVMPASARLSLESSSRSNGFNNVLAKLADVAGGLPKAGVNIGLFLREGNSSFPIGSESTNSNGEVAFSFGDALASGQYSLQLRPQDDGLIASPIEIPFIVQAKPTSLSAWISGKSVQALLSLSGSKVPVAGRLVSLEQLSKDGNWTTASISYTDSKGRASFKALGSDSVWRVMFRGDAFYSPSSSDTTVTSSQQLAAETLIVPLLGCTCACPMIVQILASPSPNCGGGGGGPPPPVPTTTSLVLPSPAYATVTLTLSARLTYGAGTGLWGYMLNFYNDGVLIQSAGTNSTGYATILWTPNIKDSHTIKAEFTGSSSFLASSAQNTLVISQTPTTIMLLKPKPIAYAKDLLRHMVIPIVTLALSNSGDGSPANIYMPPTQGSSTIPAAIPGFGWTGLNATTVTVQFPLDSSTWYIQIRNMNWTRNFYFLSPYPHSGSINVTASLAPPSNLYANSATWLIVSYQNIKASTSATGQMSQDATPPSHVYVGLQSNYPLLNLRMLDVPVGLHLYNVSAAFSLGAPGAPDSQGRYTLPAQSDEAYVIQCPDVNCSTSTPGANIGLTLYDASNRVIGTVTTNNRGIAHLFGAAKAKINSSLTGLKIAETFRHVINGNFLTNFEGYSYASWTPESAGRYLVHLHPVYLGSPYYALSDYIVLYPTQNYPDIQYPNLSGIDLFLNVEKHPVNVDAKIRPAIPTLHDATNATIQVRDLASQAAVSGLTLSYRVERTDPARDFVSTGTLTTDVNGTAVVPSNILNFGSYTLTITTPETATVLSSSYTTQFTVYKAITRLALSQGWEQNAVVNGPKFVSATLYESGTVALDNYPESNQDRYEPINDKESGFGQSGFSQSFRFSGQPSPLISIQFYLKKLGSPTGIMVARLYASNNQSIATAVPSGSSLVQSMAIPIETLTTSFAIYEFRFDYPSQYLMQPGTVYHAAIVATSGNLDPINNQNNVIMVGTDESSPTHQGAFRVLIMGGFYPAANSMDGIFYVIGKGNGSSAPERGARITEPGLAEQVYVNGVQQWNSVYFVSTRSSRFANDFSSSDLTGWTQNYLMPFATPDPCCTPVVNRQSMAVTNGKLHLDSDGYDAIFYFNSPQIPISGTYANWFAAFNWEARSDTGASSVTNLSFRLSFSDGRDVVIAGLAAGGSTYKSGSYNADLASNINDGTSRGNTWVKLSWYILDGWIADWHQNADISLVRVHPGKITFNGAPAQVVTVQLYDTLGVLRASGGAASVDVSGLTVPISGFFRFLDSSGQQLATSIRFDNIWGGDVYNWNPDHLTFVTSSQADIRFTWMPNAIGQYSVEARFPTQTYYTNSSATVSVSVARRQIALTATNAQPGPEKGQAVSWDAQVYDMINNASVTGKAIGMYLDGARVATVSTDSGGHAPFPYTFTTIGQHNVTFASDEDGTYAAARAYSPVTVYVKTSTTLSSGNSIILGQSGSFTVVLTDTDGNKLAGKHVEIRINNVVYQDLTTDGQGSATFSWKPENTGDYSFKASYAGESALGYKPSSTSLTVSVRAATSTNSDLDQAGSQSSSYAYSQGSAQGTRPDTPIVGITFPSVGTVNIQVTIGAVTISASVHLGIEFGWRCISTWLGCLWVPSMKLIVTGSLAGAIDWRFAGTLFSDINLDITHYLPFPSDLVAYGAGASAGTLIGLAANVALAASGFNLVTGFPAVTVAMWVSTAVAIAVGWGLFYNNKQSFKSFLMGLFFAMTLGIPVGFAIARLIPTPPSLPLGLLSAGPFIALAKIMWATWFVPGAQFAVAMTIFAWAIMVMMVGVLMVGVG